MIKWLLKQNYISPVIGHAKLSISYSALYINFLTNLYAGMVLYTTVLDHHFYAKFGWSPGVVAFMTFLLISYIILAILVRKFEMASTMGVNMDQQLGFSRKWKDYEQKVDRIIYLLENNKNRKLRRKIRYAKNRSL